MLYFNIRQRNQILFLMPFLLLFGCAQAAEDKTTQTQDLWTTNFEEAKQKAKESGHLILANFEGSDWCPPCIMMEKRVFSQKPFIDYAKGNLVLLKLDFPREKEQPEALKKQNEALAQKYGVEAFPTVMLINAQGEEIKRIEGYRMQDADEYVQEIKQLAEKNPEKNKP